MPEVYPEAISFEYSSETVKEYREPAEISLADVKTSPRKRRVSISGEVKEISNMENRGTKNVRRIKIEEAGNTIEVNLWGQYADSSLHINQSVKMVALEVQEFRDYKKLDTTPSFRLMFGDADDVKGRIIAISDKKLECPFRIIVKTDNSTKGITVTSHTTVSEDVDLSILGEEVVIGIGPDGNAEEIKKRELT